MPWNLILPLLAIIGLAVAFVVIKRKQDAPFKSFANAVGIASDTLRKKPESLFFTPPHPGAKEEAYDPKEHTPVVGDYQLNYRDIAYRYKYERSTEFVEFSSEGLPHVGIQYIEGDPKEVYLDGERIPDLRRYIEEHTGDMLAVRRLVRKYIGLPNSEKEVE